MLIETSCRASSNNDQQKVHITGSVKEVMRESVMTALAYL